VLFNLLEEYQQQNRRTLIFSQFTQVLDILKTILEHKNMKYLLLTGSTAVDERQGMVDEFSQDEDIQIFLLSTKAGTSLRKLRIKSSQMHPQVAWAST
jgi:SWI/SNF-related matrix-associated actin-dependent regulator 1 of chromatin subfamily A